jgi:hypothetical protein
VSAVQLHTGPYSSRVLAVIDRCSEHLCPGAAAVESRALCTRFDDAVVAALTLVGVSARAAAVFETSETSATTPGATGSFRCEYEGHKGSLKIGLDIVIDPPGSGTGATCLPGLACVPVRVGSHGVTQGPGAYAVTCTNRWSFYVSTISLPLKQALPLLRTVAGILTS